MASKKKRNKKYKGTDAVQTPATIKISAPDRSKFGQWLHDNKEKVIIRSVQAGFILVVALVAYLVLF